MALHFYIFFSLFLATWVFGAALKLSLVAGSGGYSLLRSTGFSWRLRLLLHERLPEILVVPREKTPQAPQL